MFLIINESGELIIDSSPNYFRKKNATQILLINEAQAHFYICYRYVRHSQPLPIQAQSTFDSVHFFDLKL